MAIAGLLIFAGFMIWLMLRITRRQMLLEDIYGADANDSPSVVGVDQETGQVKLAPPSDLEKMRKSWHPVRFPSSWEGRSSGFPPEKAHRDGKMDGRKVWCDKNCTGPWRVEGPDTPNPVFWFAVEKDAHEFTLSWYPFKCT